MNAIFSALLVRVSEAKRSPAGGQRPTRASAIAPHQHTPTADTANAALFQSLQLMQKKIGIEQILH
ncbi:MAG TPA: hypothetical protein V6D11_17075 [Waterburya sp.]|jgi:hypothetical protein